MQNMQTFTYEAHEVRTVEVNGEPWWVLKDVCDALGVKNVTQCANQLDDDEKAMSDIGLKNGVQANIISESGLYNVMLRSDKPQAKAFRRWVTHEVLPSIRKRGEYTADADGKTGKQKQLSDGGGWKAKYEAAQAESAAWQARYGNAIEFMQRLYTDMYAMTRKNEGMIVFVNAIANIIAYNQLEPSEPIVSNMIEVYEQKFDKVRLGWLAERHKLFDFFYYNDKAAYEDMLKRNPNTHVRTLPDGTPATAMAV